MKNTIFQVPNIVQITCMFSFYYHKTPEYLQCGIVEGFPTFPVEVKQDVSMSFFFVVGRIKPDSKDNNALIPKNFPRIC